VTETSCEVSRSWRKAKLFDIAFATSYLDREFSAVNRILVENRNRLDVVNRGGLRLLLTKVTPHIVKLAKNHQA
jgi:hypothetical protein